ncbi:ornithine carbamoyltransferase [Rhizobium leguminosarum]|uniref:ornithine carbamoyltransferase n=1 Tax=Rhizobium leguminosarum TaxID=384 RepID=UPI003F98B53C
MTKHLLSLADLTQSDFIWLIHRAAEIGDLGGPNSDLLAQRCVGVYFRKTSTRTRTSFAVAAVRLGALPLVYGPADLQTNTGESIEDTGRVLSRYLDAIVIRTAADHDEVVALAQASCIPIINAMTATEHPTQAISDFAMMKRQLGNLSGRRLIYVGEGNNTAVALAFAACRIEGFRIHLVTPEGYGLPDTAKSIATRLSAEYGGSYVEQHEVSPDIEPADVVYTSRWQTTGTTKADPDWRARFEPFRLTETLMARLSRSGDSVFMHDLPANREEDTESSVLDGPQSIALMQSEQKLYTAMAIYEWCVPR